MTEAAIQAAVFQHLAARGAPGVFAFHPANGGYRNPIEAKRLKGQGVKPGVPDIVIAARGKTYGLELKTTKGKLSHTQAATQAALNRAGWECFVAYGLDEAIQFLEFHGLVKTSPARAKPHPRGSPAASANAGSSFNPTCGND